MQTKELLKPSASLRSLDVAAGRKTKLRLRRRTRDRLTQMITGHGCFGDYLSKIGPEATANYFHYDNLYQDSVSHILLVHPAWEAKWSVLVNHIERNLSLPAVASAMLSRDSALKVVADFREIVMLQK